MGWAKRIMMDIQEHGDWPSSSLLDKFVCPHHFEDESLKAMIRDKGREGVCSYCGKKTFVRDMYSLCEDVTWKIRLYFSDIDNAGLILANSFYDDDKEVIPGYRRIGQYVAPIESTYYETKNEMLEDLGLVTDNKELNADIASVFTTEEWIARDFYEEDKTVKLSIQWEKFARAVTHHRRFTFLALPEFDTLMHEDGKNCDNILSNLQALIAGQDLIKTLPLSTKLYRARKISELNKHYGFKDLTSSPEEKSYPNRMSPAGVSMFYAAFEKETAMKECAGQDSEAIVIGAFETIKELTIVDFTRIPGDSFWRNEWQGVRFLNQFHKSITKKVDQNDRNLNQYVPTQVLTEYIRYMLKNADGNSIDGMIYSSSLTPGKNIVLFCNQKESEAFLKQEVSIELYKSNKVWEKVPDYKDLFSV